jgi:hypothetical protein
MQPPTQNLDDANIIVTPFEPETLAEEITANVVRLMLKFEVLRVQLQTPDLITARETERSLLRQHASTIRVEGFRAHPPPQSLALHAKDDDDLRRRDGVRIP